VPGPTAAGSTPGTRAWGHKSGGRLCAHGGDHQAGTGHRGGTPARWRGAAAVVALSLAAGVVPASSLATCVVLFILKRKASSSSLRQQDL
jgi:hypothetical protein